MPNYIKIPFSCLEEDGYKKLVKYLGNGASHYLLNLWVNIAIHHPEGVIDGCSSSEIEKYSDWHGRKGILFSLLIGCNFIFTNDTGAYEVTNWKKHNKHLCDRCEARKQKVRAAYICHYGKKKGIAKFNAKYQDEIPHNTADMTKQATVLLQKYERNTTKTNPKLKEKSINHLIYWLSIYTAEQISQAIDNYIKECADMCIERRYMRRSYSFFDGTEGMGFFEQYLTNFSKNGDESLKIHANDCFKSFQLSGGCSDCLKGVLNYCNYCVATNITIHQTGVLADFRGGENASTRDSERKLMGNSNLLGEQQPIY